MVPRVVFVFTNVFIDITQLNIYNMKLQPNSKSEVLNIRLTKETLKKLTELANKKSNGNKSELIRSLIDSEYRKY